MTFFLLLDKININLYKKFQLTSKDVFNILASTHKVIATIVHQKIKRDFNIELNLKKIQWGSVCPDVLPYYKLIRHYQNESIDYISNEISNLIYFCRYAKLEKNNNPILLNFLSKKLGIISHYLSDYCCYPHAYRLTFFNDMKAHIKYESDLNLYVMANKINEENYSSVIMEKDLNLFENVDKKLRLRVKNYIENAIDEYKKMPIAYETDMNFALDLSSKIAYFVIESILAYNEDYEIQFC